MCSVTERLIIVSNRLPIPQGPAQQLTAGGVVSALLPTVADRGGVWLGWSGRVQEAPEVRRTRASGVDLVAIDLTPEAFDGYYRGFSNATLWPLMHGLESRARFAESDYEQYREVNRTFALHARARLLPGEVVWVHDYQLIPHAEELRALGWEGSIGYFHHTPIPSRSRWRRIPHAEELTRALMAYTHIGVQTARDAQHLRAILGRHAPTIEVQPVPIDSVRVREMAAATPSVFDEEEIAGRTVLFGVDRLDYTKGIPLRLEAWERALERHPELRDRAVFVQWAAPSREGVDEYREERATIEAIAARIQQRFGGALPAVMLSIEEHSYAETAAALQRADIALVTSIADGMNLVAKEFSAVHSAENPGVLILSDGCGAVAELESAIVVDRRSVAALADGISTALAMPEEERRTRSDLLRQAVGARSSSDWAGSVVDHIAAGPPPVTAWTGHMAPPPPARLAAPLVPRLVMSPQLRPRLRGWLKRLHRTSMTDRLWRRDPSLWPGAHDVTTNRLGWLALDDWLGDHLRGLRSFSLGIADARYTTAVVLGMGGSSAAARALARLGSATPRGLRVLVLDSTAPEAIRDIERQIDPGRTLFIVASKSGTTVETRAFLDYFWERHPEGRDFIAITDAGTPLADVASERHFRRQFLNPADIGGRFSALSYPGLLPAALSGLDLDLLAIHARAMARACRRSDPAKNPGTMLAALLAELAVEDRGMLFIEVDDRLVGLDDWIAQLVAESSGKNGRGLLPIRVRAQSATYSAGDTVLLVGDASAERIATLQRAGCNVVRSPLVDRHAIAAEFVRWQVGVALACSLIGVNAFDEPDVASAKRATVVALSEGVTAPAGIERMSRALTEVARRHDPRDFVAIHAYVARTPWMERRLETLRRRLGERYGLPVALEFGPTLLHATGQYYKGGTKGGLVVQVVDAQGDLPIPGRSYGFGTLLAAQAQGDAHAMVAAGRRVATATIAELAVAIELLGAPRTTERDLSTALLP